jgi:hypothetical protein
MRFEIGPAGMCVLVLGLAGLTGTLFGLGLLAGHELAAPGPEAYPADTLYSQATTPKTLSSAPPARHRTNRADTSSSANTFMEAGGSLADESDDDSARLATSAEAASDNPTAQATDGPYSVEFDEVLDYQRAQQIAKTLRAKGFQAYIVQTKHPGRYRLRVGHYASAEQAQAAEAMLHDALASARPVNLRERDLGPTEEEANPTPLHRDVGNPIFGHWICNRMTNIMNTQQYSQFMKDSKSDQGSAPGQSFASGEVRSCAPPVGGLDITFTPESYTTIVRFPSGTERSEEEMPMPIVGYVVNRTPSGWRVEVDYTAPFGSKSEFFDISRDRNHLTDNGGWPLKMEYTRNPEDTQR